MKRALLVGINYVGTPSQLYGCINDIDNVAEYLKSARGYESRCIIVMSDTTPRKPTRANILAGFRELLQGVRFTPGLVHTQSLVMRSRSGTVRVIDAQHRLDKISEFSAIDYS
jgi:hypothetical protein